ncbi:MAG: 50S ribosomal protein L18 [Candidatus Aenigmatarchaeota archaeon]|nr:50S ribosomal protein L18 [Candidatus Aenigmarchaeota archaeon]
MFRKLKRRVKKKTDYYQRLGLLKSKLPRLVVRKSLKNILAQVVEYKPQGDHIITSSISKELRKYGWKGGNNLPAAYLTGLLIGLKAKKLGIKKVILDIGLQRSVKGSKIYALAKGCLDAGIEIPIGDEVMPIEDRIKGKHIENYAKLLKEKGLYERFFSQALKEGLKPEEISKHFEEVKKNLLENFKE